MGMDSQRQIIPAPPQPYEAPEPSGPIPQFTPPPPSAPQMPSVPLPFDPPPPFVPEITPHASMQSVAIGNVPHPHDDDYIDHCLMGLIFATSPEALALFCIKDTCCLPRDLNKNPSRCYPDTKSCIKAACYHWTCGKYGDDDTDLCS